MTSTTRDEHPSPFVASSPTLYKRGTLELMTVCIVFALWMAYCLIGLGSGMHKFKPITYELVANDYIYIHIYIYVYIYIYISLFSPILADNYLSYGHHF